MTIRSHVIAPVVIGAAMLLAQPVGDASCSAQDTQIVIDYEAIKASYGCRAQRLEELKAELYKCLYSIEWDQRFWDVLVEHEIPHKAFRALQDEFPDLIASAFRDRSDLAYKRGKRLFLHKDVQAAWTYVHSETLTQLMYEQRQAIAAEFERMKRSGTRLESQAA